MKIKTLEEAIQKMLDRCPYCKGKGEVVASNKWGPIIIGQEGNPGDKHRPFIYQMRPCGYCGDARRFLNDTNLAPAGKQNQQRVVGRER